MNPDRYELIRSIKNVLLGTTQRWKVIYALPRILQTVVPQPGHLPFIILVLFFVTVSFPSLISTIFLHFIHRPCILFTFILFCHSGLMSLSTLNVQRKNKFFLYFVFVPIYS